MQSSIHFSFVSADKETKQQRTSEGSRSRQTGAGWSLAPRGGGMGSHAALHGRGLPTEDAGKSLVTTVVFS